MESNAEKCRKHPFQPVIGVCPYCLSDRLRLLCPECASLRPCKCSLTPSENPYTFSSSSSSFDFPKNPTAGAGQIGAVGLISDLIDSEPTFRLSRSARVAELPFIRSKSRATNRAPEEPVPNPPETRRKWSLWSLLAPEKQNKGRNHPMEKTMSTETAKLSRSRSVGGSFHRIPSHLSKNPVPAGASGEGGAATAKGKGWSFSSTMGVFRQPKAVNGRSPMCRG